VFGALAHPAHVDLLIEARDVLGDGALQQVVVLGDESFNVGSLRLETSKSSTNFPVAIYKVTPRSTSGSEGA
jgi:hypothetical protein